MFRCKYCHNPDTIPTENEKANHWWEKEILSQVKKQQEYFWKEWWVTFSWWEPLYQAPALIPVIKKLKEQWFHVCIDTNGYMQTKEAREVLSMADLILPDLKHINPETHRKLTWQSNENTLKTLDYLDEIEKPYRLRYVLVPWYTDNEDDLKKLGEYFTTRKSAERLEILPYHNLWKSKWDKLGRKYPLEWVPAAGVSDLNRAKEILSKYSDKIFTRW